MCLVVPLKVKKELKEDKGWYVMEDGRKVRSLVKGIKIGDYLICQQDLAIEKVPADEAQLIRNALQEGV